GGAARSGGGDAGKAGGAERAGGLYDGCDPESPNRKSDGGGGTAGAGPPGRTLGSGEVASRSIVPRPPSGAGPSSWSRSFFADRASRPSLSIWMFTLRAIDPNLPPW